MLPVLNPRSFGGARDVEIDVCYDAGNGGIIVAVVAVGNGNLWCLKACVKLELEFIIRAFFSFNLFTFLNV